MDKKLGDVQPVRLLSQGGSWEANLLCQTEEGQDAIVTLKPSFGDPLAVLGKGSKAGQAVEDHRNDKFSGYTLEAPLHLQVGMICPASEKDMQKYSAPSPHLLRESPGAYAKITRPYVDALPVKSVQWVYNILEGKSEQEDVVLSTADVLILPDTKWDRKDNDSVYMLGIVHRRDLKSIRDLRGGDVELLCGIRQSILGVMKDRYGQEPSRVRMFFHYHPTFWHLHLHAVGVLREAGPGMEAGRAILLDDVIENLRLDGDYYTKVSLTVNLKEGTELYKQLQAA